LAIASLQWAAVEEPRLTCGQDRSGTRRGRHLAAEAPCGDAQGLGHGRVRCPCPAQDV